MISYNEWTDLDTELRNKLKKKYKIKPNTAQCIDDKARLRQSTADECELRFLLSS